MLVLGTDSLSSFGELTYINMNNINILTHAVLASWEALAKEKKMLKTSLAVVLGLFTMQGADQHARCFIRYAP